MPRTYNSFFEPADHAHGRLIGHLEMQMELVRRDGSFCPAQYEAGLEPFVQGDMAAFENRSDRSAKLLAAVAAEFQSSTRTLAGHGADTICGAAADAYRTVWPNHCLELGVGCLLIPEVRLREDGHESASEGNPAGAEKFSPVIHPLSMLSQSKRIRNLKSSMMRH